jgi:hypothetical protein
MPDTKISALTAAGSAAGANEIPINEAGTTKKITVTQLNTFVNTAPSFAAGTATAGTWPKLNAGTLLTTAEAGALELDANCLYGTTDAGNRGVIPIRNFIRADATRTFTSNTSSQAIFTSPANGRITLETGCYLVEGVLHFSAMSATSGNLLVNLLGAGTATVAAWLWTGLGNDAASATASAASGVGVITSTSPASIVLAATGVTLTVFIRGSFEVTAAGTMIPSITMVTASASVLSIGSYLLFERIGSTSVVSVGQWD